MIVVALSFRGIEVDFYFRNRPDLRTTCKIRNSLSSVFLFKSQDDIHGARQFRVMFLQIRNADTSRRGLPWIGTN
jgi:hypothetical protein